MSTLATALAASFLVLPAVAQDADTEGAEVEVTYEEFLADFASQLQFQSGDVEVASGKAKISLPEGWAMLGAGDARRVVEDLWGNPEDPSVIAFLDPPSEGGRLGSDYGIIITNDESGLIPDEDAADIDFDEMLADMKAGTKEENEARAAAGYETVDLIGWAAPPRYDAEGNKLSWAQELYFEGSDGNTVNYDVRILGRHGYLSLMAVAPMSAFDEMDAGMKAILGVTEFNDGSRYEDFDSSIDKVAAVGIGGLIAGKVAAKAGLLAVFAKFGKVIVLGVIGAFVALRRFVFGGSKEEPEPEEAPAA